MDKIIILECLTNKFPILNYLGFSIGVNAQISGKQRKRGTRAWLKRNPLCGDTASTTNMHLFSEKQRKAAKANARPLLLLLKSISNEIIPTK